MRLTLAACRELISELKMGPQDWTVVAGVVMTILNEAPLKRLGNNNDGSYRSPLQVLTGLKLARSHLTIGHGKEVDTAKCSLDRVRATQLVQIDIL